MIFEKFYFLFADQQMQEAVWLDWAIFESSWWQIIFQM